MKLVIKVGTQSILSADGTVQISVMELLVDQIATLQQAGHQVILVSSGAVASGRRVVRELFGREFGNSLGEKQVLASLGQPTLMQVYGRLLEIKGMLGAQLLLTKQDFQTRQHYLNIARLLREILEKKNILPIINENDSVSIEELMFTDNDELAGLIASQLNADRLMILTSVKGVFDGHPDDPASTLISKITPQEKGWPTVSAIKSSLGRGGMLSKLEIARKMSDLGITTHIASLAEPNVLPRLLEGELLGTTILPIKKKSNLKRWMAWSQGQQQGIIHINSCLWEILKENKRVISILPVGIDKSEGSFEKGDLVEIVAPDGQKIGVGLARYGSEKLQEYLGVKGKPEFIHYDHLHIKQGV